MKSKITKIQKIFMKGIAVVVSSMLVFTPITYASTSLNDNGNIIEEIIGNIIYGTVGNTVEAIRKHFDSGYATLVINNEQQLRAFAAYVNSGEDCSQKVIKLGRDIDVNSNVEWVPIGKEGAAFKGIFDGNGYTIFGINFNRNNKLNSEITNVGLFGYIENANIKNINVNNSRFSIPYILTPDLLGTSIDVNIQANDNGMINISNPTYRCLGGIVGYNNNGNILNCTISNTEIAGLLDVGGIVGYNNNGKVSNCKATSSSIKSLKYAGGIVGTNVVGTVESSTNEASVYAFQNSGGIVGANYGGHTLDGEKAIIKNSINKGNVSAFIEAVGGVAGRSIYMSEIEACINEGTIKIETNDIELQALKTYIIKTSNESIGTIYQQNIGGIAGWVSGDKEGTTELISRVNSCRNMGAVYGVQDVGGLVGQFGGAGGGKAVLSNSTNLSSDIIPVIYTVDTSVTPNTETVNGESGYITGEMGADGATLYLYNNKYKTSPDSEEQIAQKVGENAVYNNNEVDTKAKEYGTIIKKNTVHFIEDVQSGNEQGTSEEGTSEQGESNPTVSPQEGMEYIPEEASLENIGYNSENVNENEVREIKDLVDENTNTKVTYSIYKVSGEIETEITGEDYLKVDDTLKIVAKFDKYLANSYGPLRGIGNDVMKLYLKDSNNNIINMDSESLNESEIDYTTSITYTYTIKRGEEFAIDSIILNRVGEAYAVKDDYETNHPEMLFTEKETSINRIRIDTVAPKIETKIYVENQLETGRYTAGKEVLISMTTSEEVQDISEIPTLRVAFDKSGAGKYNYKGEEYGSGYAKPIDGKIDENGILNIVYSYQIQEGDEGNIAVAYNGTIKDLAGNECDLSKYKQFEDSSNYTGANLQYKLNGKNVAWKNTSEADKKDIEFLFYKNTIDEQNRIKNASYINENDTIIVQAKIKGFVYVNYDNGTSGNYAIFLDDSKTEYIPKLTINNKIINGRVSKNHELENSIEQASFDDAETTITYTISGEEFGYSERTLLSTMKFTLGDRVFISNRYVNRFAEGTSTSTTNESETDEPDENTVWDISSMNKMTTLIESNYAINDIDISGLCITVDTTGIAETFKGTIYADTTAPTVNISAYKLQSIDDIPDIAVVTDNPEDENFETEDLDDIDTSDDELVEIINSTNAEVIKYVFEFSEPVNGFTEDDIGLNFGTVALLKEVEGSNHTKYEVYVFDTSSPENTVKDLKIVLEQNAVQDFAYNGNIRKEHTITIDKKRPKLENYTVEHDGEKIIVIAKFDEPIYDLSISDLKVKVGGKEGRGSVETEVLENEDSELTPSNMVKYVYTISGEDGGKVELNLTGYVVDFAGNYSEELDVNIENDIDPLERSTIIIGDKEYIFYKGKGTDKIAINNYAIRNYFKKGDSITVKEIIPGEIVDEIEQGAIENFYEFDLRTDGIDLKQEKYMKLIPATTEDPNASLLFATDRISNDYLDITSANIWFDTVAPTVSTEIIREKESNIYGKGEEFRIVVRSSEELKNSNEIVPNIKVKFGENEGKYNLGQAQIVDVIHNEDGKTTWIYKYVISEGDEGEISLSFDHENISDLADNSIDLADLNDEEDIFNTLGIVADTTLPTVEITAKKKEDNTSTAISGNVTNANTIEYTFTWSESVVGFTESDITVNNGVKSNFGRVVVNGVETNVYKVDVTPTIENGNTGDVQVIIEQDAVKDRVGYGNVRTESVIRVDKQAPILIGLEAYGESAIDVDRDVDTIKQYYKAEENKYITIVATFSENIQASSIPTLELQFSESGNAQGQVSQGSISGNKITYTYSITGGDNGKLSVKGFSGTVKDPAGNETVVTKRNLDGDTIIADTVAPRLKELKVVSPEDGTYKAGNRITIEAIYDEDVYVLDETNTNNKIIKLINSDNAPSLLLKFGNKNAVNNNGYATYEGYSTKEDGTENRSILVYSYVIHDGTTNDNGDNGELAINSYTNRTNLSICDIAGNKAILNTYKTGNNIIADTTRPIVTNIVGVVTDPTINNTDIYYKEGNKVKITLTFSEKISAAVLMPKIQVGFSENTNVEPSTYNDYAYESDWNVNSETIEYTYEIKDGDNGYLWVKVPENQFADIARNGNIAKEAIKLNVYADTIRPTVTLLRDTEVGQNNQVITIKAKFSEAVYDLNNNNRIALTTQNAPKLIYSFGTGENKEAVATGVSGDTITYRINKDAVNDNGTLRYELAKGNLCDRAGNLYYIETTDTTAPELLGVTISSDSEYGVYCKKDVVVTIKALFDEDIATQNMKMKIKVGDKDVEPLEGTINEEYKREIIYTYIVKENDNGEISIVDVVGNTTTETPARTFGWVRDAKGNQKNVFDLSGVTVSGTAIADTTAPIATITVYPEENYDFNDDGYINDEDAILLGSSLVEEDIDETVLARILSHGDINGDRTIDASDVTALQRSAYFGKSLRHSNNDSIKYTITWSEPVSEFNTYDLDINNGLIAIDSFKQIDEEGKVYTVDVDCVSDGIQTLKIKANACIDRAGNSNSQRVVHNINIDRNKPVVRIRENGGNYVLGTNGKSLLKTELVVNEEISEMKYIWTKSDTLPEDSNEWITVPNNTIGSNSDIPVNAVASETGTYYLYIKVTDLAGNTLIGRTNGFVVSNDSITITSTNTNPTNQDVIVNVTYGTVLTENRRAGIQGKTQSADSTKVVSTENGVVYAEATDKNGNKVFATLEVSNIDKTAPTATISYNTNEDGSVTATVNFTEENVTVINPEGIVVIDGKATHTFTENGEFTFEYRDTVGNTGTAVAKVTSIKKQDTHVDPSPLDPTPTDTTAPEITDIMVQGRRIAISANESDVYYLITTTSEKPNKDNTGWSKNSIITVNNDGKYYAWVMDNAKNISTQVKDCIVNTSTTVPVIDVNTSDSRISKYTENGITYIIVLPTVSVNELKDKITVTNGDRSKLSITEISNANKLKTTSLVKYDGKTKFIIIVQGDVNRDGEVSFNDVLGANSMRGAENNYLGHIRLAADINGDKTISFNEVLAINAIRTK